jgi:hypothetical protein
VLAGSASRPEGDARLRTSDGIASGAATDGRLITARSSGCDADPARASLAKLHMFGSHDVRLLAARGRTSTSSATL